MGAMKDFLLTVRNGGDEAVAAVQRMGDDWRAMLEQASSEIEAARLTPEERMAVAWAVDAAKNDEHPAEDILRGLLERMK